jgi:hypothetical protein
MIAMLFIITSIVFTCLGLFIYVDRSKFSIGITIVVMTLTVYVYTVSLLPKGNDKSIEEFRQFEILNYYYYRSKRRVVIKDTHTDLLDYVRACKTANYKSGDTVSLRTKVTRDKNNEITNVFAYVDDCL